MQDKATESNEYSGSGHFVGDSSTEVTKAPEKKQSSISDRKIGNNNSIPEAKAKDIDTAQIAADTNAISDSLGNPSPPIGHAIQHVLREAAPYIATGLGLKAAWDLLSSNKAQTSNEGAKGGWDKTTAGRPQNSALGAMQTPPPEAAIATQGVSPTTPADVIPKPAPFAQGSAPQPNVAYQEPSYNQPKGTPNPLLAAPAAPPITANAEITPPTMPSKAEREHQSWVASEQRKNELHAKKMATEATNDVKRAEKTVQNSQGEASFNKDTSILGNAKNVEIDKGVQAKGLVKPSAPIISPAAPEAAPTTPTTITPTEDVSAVAGGNKPSAAKRRTAEQMAEINAERPYSSAKSSILNNLGSKDSPEMEAKARAALSTLKDKVYGGERVAQTGSHVNEQWSKGKAYILAHPEEFDPEIVARQKKSGEQIKSENQTKKSSKAAESQRGGANVNAIGEAGSKVAGAVKPILGQTGALVGSELKGAAAMLPFMLATDVQAQNAGYRRELEQQMKTERNASRSAELKSELQKLDEEKYLKAMKRRYVDRNVPAQFRPQ